MPDILMRLGSEILVAEGAMGTMLTRAGMLPGSCPELLNITAPDMVAQVHRLYELAGADCAITNTFGGTRAKLAEYGYEDRVEEFNRAAVRIARRHGAAHVLGDIGPTGLLLDPLGPASFDEVFDIFAEQAAALAAEGPDAILIETMTDIAEARCALLAARSVTDLPVFVTVTMGSNGWMDLSATDPATAAVILEAAGATAVGLNCGLGPEQMVPLLAEMAAATTLPLIVQPNAGMPYLDEAGQTVFPGTPQQMYEAALRFAEIGAAVVGSCCGSTPAFTSEIVGAVADRPVSVHGPDRTGRGVVLAGPRRVVTVGARSPLRVIGERINPTGKVELQEELRAGSMSLVRRFAAEQEAAGADLLDVNVGAAGLDEATLLPAATLALVGSTDLPLVLDSSDPAAIEAALRVYPGRALVNSVNGGQASLEALLPVAARYGAAVIALALDDAGIPGDVGGRVAVVSRIRQAAAAAGLRDEDIVVDSLVMTAATDPEAPEVTLAATQAAKEQGLATVLGVSNVSHGLPDRPLLNAAFVGAAAARGLDAAIANPNDHVVMDAVRVANEARAHGFGTDAHDEAMTAWRAALQTSLAHAAEGTSRLVADDAPQAQEAVTAEALAERLAAAVVRGDADHAPELAERLIAAGSDPGAVIADVLTPAIQRLGDAYGRGEVFLPQMMIAAEAMKAAVARAKSHMPAAQAAQTAGRVVFATVKGDIHSIGKDICVSLLESQGFAVRDLGVDVGVAEVLEALDDADAVCLSALMTTTLRSMADTIAAVHDARPGLPVLVGGAVVNESWAAERGAGYSDDAPGCVNAVRAAISRSGA